MPLSTNNPTCPDSSLTRGLNRLRETLILHPQAADCPYPKLLDTLCQHLDASSPALLERFERVSYPLRAVVATLQRAASKHEIDALDWRELLGVLTRLHHVRKTLARGGHANPEDLALHYRVTAMPGLLQELTNAFEPLAAERGVALRLHAPPVLNVEVDTEKIQVVLLNLLFNAFKFTPRDRSITCRLDVDDRVGEFSVSVTDGGPGIASERAEELFTSSRQVDRSVFLNLGSVRFSLAGCRDIARLHGGDLVVLPQLGSDGCSFRATFPRSAPRGSTPTESGGANTDLIRQVVLTAKRELSEEASLSEQVVVRHGGRPLVLIVEDSRSIQRIVAECLRSTCETVCAFDGLGGLQMAQEVLPDLIISDIRMPRMDGTSMIAALRNRAELAEVPILVLTGVDDPRGAVNWLEGGAQDVMRKPFLAAELRARATALLDAKRARDILVRSLGKNELDIVGLADQVAQRTKTLESALADLSVARQDAESASRVKSNFLRMMSHELKTPLAAIQLHLHVLQKATDRTATPMVTQLVCRMERSSQRLLRLIDTCIEWARVESGRCRPARQKFELVELITETSGLYEDQARDKGVRLCFSPSSSTCWLTNDRRMVALVVSNLVERAVQNRTEGSVEVTLAGTERSAYVTVSGVVESNRSVDGRLGERIAALTGDTELDSLAGSGSGLGLYVIRDIVRALGGDLHQSEQSVSNGSVTLELCAAMDPQQ